MADINSSITFSKSSLAIIKSKMASKFFSHVDWANEDLEILRKEIRDFYKTVQKGKCSYCKLPVSLVSPLNCHVEHIVPKSLHLKFIFTPRNFCVICADCNQIKRKQETLFEIPDTITNPEKRKFYPTSSGAFKIVHPHFDVYEDHILIVNGYYIDKGSKKGNFTIGACNLNRKLGMFGWEPIVTNDSELISAMNSYINEVDFHKRHQQLLFIKEKLFN